MSAPVADVVLRELSAKARTFATVKGALLWYRDQLSRRLSASRDPTAVGSQKSETTDPTFAAIAACLVRKHPADETAEGLEISPLGRWRKQPAWTHNESIVWLVAWYENTSDDGSDMAVEAGLETQSTRRNPDASWLALQAGISRKVFNRRCKKTSYRLRLRLLAAGVLT